MRVLYFHQYFSTPEGSASLRSYEFARALTARGHTVCLVCGRQDRGSLRLPDQVGPRERRGRIAGFEVVELDYPYSNHFSLLQRALVFARFAAHSCRLALREPHDLLCATSTPLTIALPGILRKTLAGGSFVFEVRDLWPELPRAMGVVRHPALLAALSILEWSAYRAADGAVGLAPGITAGIRRRARAELPLATIPNACDLELFHPGLRRPLPWPELAPGDFSAVFTGAHGLANGLGAVLDAAAVLRRRVRHDIKLALIGDGREKPALRERARAEGLDNCLFLDPLPKRALAEVVCSAGAGLQILRNVPEFYYGTSPNKFFDYLAAGLPVINNYPGWVADLIRRHGCGLAVPPDQPEALADALVWLADHPAERASMGARARALAEREFDRGVLAERFVDFLEAIHHREG